MPTFDEDDLMIVPAAAAIPDITGLQGTPNSVLVDVTGTPTQAAINDNFADVAAKINGILAALRAANILPED